MLSMNLSPSTDSIPYLLLLAAAEEEQTANRERTTAAVIDRSQLDQRSTDRHDRK